MQNLHGVESFPQQFSGIFPRKLIFPGALRIALSGRCWFFCTVVGVPWVTDPAQGLIFSRVSLSLHRPLLHPDDPNSLCWRQRDSVWLSAPPGVSRDILRGKQIPFLRLPQAALYSIVFQTGINLNLMHQVVFLSPAKSQDSLGWRRPLKSSPAISLTLPSGFDPSPCIFFLPFKQFSFQGEFLGCLCCFHFSTDNTG